MAFFDWTRWLRSVSRPRVKTYRKNSTFVPLFEALEDRTLMATLPAAIVDNPSTIAANGFSPSLVQDPINPLKLVEVHTTGSALVAQFSIDGGESWSTFGTFTKQTDP